MKIALLLISLLITSACAKEPAGSSAEKGGGRAPSLHSEDPWTAYLVYRYDLSKERGEEAKASLARARVLDPSSPFLLLEEAELSALRGDLGHAETLVEQALELNPENANATALLGKIAMATGLHLRAIELYEKTLSIDPEALAIYPLLIQEYLRLGETKKTLELTQQLVKYSVDNAESYFLLGLIYEEHLNQAEDAIKAYKKALLYTPRDTRILGRIAELYLVLGDLDAALSHFEQVKELMPSNLNNLLKIALIYHERNEREKAKETFHSILKINPKSDTVNYYIGILYRQEDKHGLARMHFKKISNESKHYQDAQGQIILSYLEEQRPEQAKKLSEQAIKRFPRTFYFYELLAACFEELNDSDKILTLWDSLAKDFDDNWRYHYAVALYHEQQGNWQRAVHAMNRVLELDPENATALNYIGYTYIEQNIEHQQAVALLQKAVAIAPDNGYILDSLGWAYLKTGKLKQAKQSLDRAGELTRFSEPTVLDHLGDLYLTLGQRDKAFAYYRKALHLLEKSEDRDLSREEKKTLEGLERKLPSKPPS